MSVFGGGGMSIGMLWNCERIDPCPLATRVLLRPVLAYTCSLSGSRGDFFCLEGALSNSGNGPSLDLS